ncbi:MAG TPA: MBL fold metallo-hydrolase [Streptosporangiaceae bacterium]|jgi:glyoxylase-like metal-dependent hydrolase (beta-lactamase superfamily II)|nr:MBL fold metallo-hydrolase [Streptosporangiaceae bacterium]
MDVVEVLPGLLHEFRFVVGQAYLWQDRDSVTLIDAGPAGQADSIAAALADLGLSLSGLRRIVLTHFHDDHVGSAAELAARSGARVLAHRVDAPVIRGDMPGPAPQFTDEEKTLRERMVAGASGQSSALPAAPSCPVDQELASGDLIDLGGGAAVIGATGHTDGSIAIHIPSQRLLFTGDSVAANGAGQVILGPFNVDREQAIETFRGLAKLDVDTACFGHGDPVRTDASAALRDAVRGERFTLGR